MATLAPRVIVVSRPSELEELLERQGTRAAAAHFLRQRERSMSEVELRHDLLNKALDEVSTALPSHWRRGHVGRNDLPRFLFGPEDIVITVGQDGLVANVAKYLTGQPVIGVNPEPGRNPGVLARFFAHSLASVLARLTAGRASIEARTMVMAELDDGQQLSGLNEIYIGHSGHQSSRYLLTLADGQQEHHSSSGIVVGTGTGATGWCISIAGERGLEERLPAPMAPELVWFVREAWPSPATGASLTAGRVHVGEQLTIACEGERLVAFADGVESDHLVLTWGQKTSVRLSPQVLNLVVS